MLGAAGVDAIIGMPQVSAAGGFDSVAKVPVGTIVSVQDPIYGGQELIYLKMPTSQAAKVGAILAYDPAVSFTAALVANTANLGKPVAFLKNALASSASAQFGWAIIAGSCPVWCSASVAADTGFGIVAAGQGGAVAAGKSILNARVTLPATTAFVKAGTIVSLAQLRTLIVPNTDNLFVGQAVTGTGVGASALVSGFGQDPNAVLVSVDSTAAGAVSVTFTNNDATNFWNTVTCNRPFAQGPIT